MFIKHATGVLYKPHGEWRSIEMSSYTARHIFLKRVPIMALIPAVSLFIGVTQVGWSYSPGVYIKLSTESALAAAFAFYSAMLCATVFLSLVINWMKTTYGGRASFDDCSALTAFVSLPMFIAGFSCLWPVLWFNVSVAMLAVIYSIYLLYSGVPEVMHIPNDRAFLFSTSVVTVGLCVLVAMMAASVIIWIEWLPLTYIG